MLNFLWIERNPYQSEQSLVTARQAIQRHPLERISKPVQRSLDAKISKHFCFEMGFEMPSTIFSNVRHCCRRLMSRAIKKNSSQSN